MSFFGVPTVQPGHIESSMRTFAYKSCTGKERSVRADYVQFMTDHVTFWLETPEGQYDQLVLAEDNRNVQELREVAE